MIKNKSLLVTTFEPPYPPNHGGRVDQWSRYNHLKELGWDLSLITWVRASNHPDIAGLRKALHQSFSHVYLLKHELTAANLLVRLIMLPLYSQHISAFYVSRKERNALIAQMGDWRPAAIIMDHIYPLLLCRTLAKELNVPLIYRAHNIEHIYVRQMASASRNFLDWMKMRLAELHMKRHEYDVHRRAAWSFDCSVNDLGFWQDQGFSDQSWAPPLVDLSSKAGVKGEPWSLRPYDAVFLGNLHTAANIEAIHWFLSRVMPEIVRRKPDIKVLVAGSRPVSSLRRAASAWPQVELLADPVDAAATRAKGRVQINPILRGSGINVKLIEMLFSDAPIITSPVGLRGFDDESRRAFVVADSPTDFAAKLVTALAAGPVDPTTRKILRDRFSGNGADALAARLEQIIEDYQFDYTST